MLVFHLRGLHFPVRSFFCVLFQMLTLSEGWSAFINNQPLFWEISIITAEIYHSAFSSLNMPALMSDWDSRAFHSDVKLMEQTLPRIVLRELGKCVPFLLFLHWFIRYTLEWVNAEASLAISTRDMSLSSRWAAQHLWPPGNPMWKMRLHCAWLAREGWKSRPWHRKAITLAYWLQIQCYINPGKAWLKQLMLYNAAVMCFRWPLWESRSLLPNRSYVYLRKHLI